MIVETIIVYSRFVKYEVCDANYYKRIRRSHILIHLFYITFAYLKKQKWQVV